MSILTKPRIVVMALALAATSLLPLTAANAAPGDMVQPAQGSVTGIYGAHCNDGSAHKGYDIARSAGGPIIAAAAGTVVTAVNSSGTAGYGTYVVIDHGNTYSTLYGHMIAGSLAVAPGTVVGQGTVIGQMGSTGNSTGTHLHFEVRINGVSQGGLNSVYACGQSITRGSAIQWSFPNFGSSSAARIAVLQADGSLQVKEGLNGTWVTVANDVVSYDVSGTRVGIVDSTGEALVKEGPLNAMWTSVATGASRILLEGSRIAVIKTNGDFFVKEGGVTATFHLVTTGVVQAELGGNRIVIRNGANLIQAKEGGIGAAWLSVTTATDFDVSATHLVVIDAAGNASMKAGALDAMWQALNTNVSDVQISPTRIVIRTGGTLQAMDTAVGAWMTLTTNVTDFSVSDSFVGTVQGGSAVVKQGALGSQWTLVSTGTSTIKVTG
jgi:hypothetical protein